jgi:hypothetical protein
VQVPQPTGGLSLRPAIEAVLEGGRGGVAAELSYLTGGLSWTAEHTLVRTGETSAQWSAVVLVENTTGRDYVEADVKLVAGEPSRTTQVAGRPMLAEMRTMALAAKAPEAELAEQTFSEYHLYTLQRPATLRDRETQSLTLIDPRPVTVTPRYVYRGGDARGVAARLELVNSAAAGPGVPLPAGRVRVFQRDDSGALQFTGEDRIEHVPVDEKLGVDVGYAFDLAAERKLLSERRSADREREYAVEIRLRNRKSIPVTIRVEETVGGDTQVIQESQPSTRKDATTLQWTIDVAAGKEAVLTYTARQRW